MHESDKNHTEKAWSSCMHRVFIDYPLHGWMLGIYSEVFIDSHHNQLCTFLTNFL